MKHHFGDMLDRDGDYWTLIPNRERYAYYVGNVPAGSKEITVATISKNDECWERVFSFPNLIELTLHEPSKEQIEAVSKLVNLKRLRITHARVKNIEFMQNLAQVEELVLEYVSGFSDLSPIKFLKKLKSLHLENLRKVSDFSGLSDITSLKYLHITGTLDWKQPIKDFQFLLGLPNLEVLSFGQVINKSEFPALLPVLSLQHLKKLKMTNTMVAAKEYALLALGLPNVKGADFGPYQKFAYSSIPLAKDDIRLHLPEDTLKNNHPEVHINYQGERRIGNPEDTWFEFTGKGAGRVKLGSAKCEERCAQYSAIYDEMKEEVKRIID